MSKSPHRRASPSGKIAAKAPGPSRRAQESQGGKKAGFRPWMLLGPLLLLSVALGVFSGYQAGLEDRQRAIEAQVANELFEQFRLGVEDLSAGRYHLARERAEYILSVDPNHEGAIGLLDLALQALNRPTVTPTPLASPTPVPPTPAPDLSTLASTLESARASMEVQDWDSALELLLELRARDPTYLAAEVNALMFTILRNRGLEKILRGELEQGIYDLTLAERFKPLDSQALSWRRSAEFYLFANSFVGLDWAQAYQAFIQLCGAAIWDSCYKYAISAHGYGDDLILQEDPCGAMIPYEQSLMILLNDQLVPTATQAAVLCMTATFEPSPTPTGSLTPTPDLTTSPTPTPTPTPTVGGSPIETPTPTPSPTQDTES